ncbi:MAG: hypothetical protein ABI769_20575 [Pseudomonadota bacterium]
MHAALGAVGIEQLGAAVIDEQSARRKRLRPRSRDQQQRADERERNAPDAKTESLKPRRLQKCLSKT